MKEGDNVQLPYVCNPVCAVLDQGRCGDMPLVKDLESKSVYESLISSYTKAPCVEPWGMYSDVSEKFLDFWNIESKALEEWHGAFIKRAYEQPVKI